MQRTIQVFSLSSIEVTIIFSTIILIITKLSWNPLFFDLELDELAELPGKIYSRYFLIPSNVTLDGFDGNWLQMRVGLWLIVVYTIITTFTLCKDLIGSKYLLLVTLCPDLVGTRARSNWLSWIIVIKTTCTMSIQICEVFTLAYPIYSPKRHFYCIHIFNYYNTCN